MALNHALLAALSHQPQTGYDLARSFDESLGYFWQASHQQIYRELARLEELGFVACELIPQAGKPNRKVYTATEAGLQSLREWIAQPGQPVHHRDELLVKFFAGSTVDPAVLSSELAHHQGLHAELLATYEQIERDYFMPVETLSPVMRMSWLTLQCGLAYERSWRDWSELAARTLKQMKLDMDQVSS